MTPLLALGGCFYIGHLEFERRTQDPAADDTAPPQDSTPRDSEPDTDPDTGPVSDRDGDGTPDADDCAPDDPAVHPGQPDPCDEIDNDCDGQTDEEPDIWYPDVDEDGYGATGAGAATCTPTAGWVDVDGDCDDSDPTRNPDATESCSTPTDDDCDGSTNDPGATGCDAWFEDDDADGYGSTTLACLCVAEAPYTAQRDDDCEDTSADAHPGAREVCDDGLDNDCDGGSNGCGISGTLSDEDAPIRYLGSVAGAYFGYGLAIAGDMTGDGVQDLAIGGFGDNTYAQNGGSTWYIDGALTGSVDADPDAFASVHGELYEDRACIAWPVGDLDGDGLADVLQQEGYTDEGAYLLTAPLSGEVDPLAATTTYLLGKAIYSATGAVDLLGDGLPAVAVDGDGALYLFEAAASGALGTSDAVASLTPDSGERLGDSIDAAGDVDGDGVPDLVVGDQTNGEVYVLLGPVSGDKDPTDADGDLYGDGTDLAGDTVRTGDVNGDGLDDVLITAPALGGPDTGGAYLVLAPVDLRLSLASADATFSTTRIWGLGISGALADIDSDGTSDVLLGAPYAAGVGWAGSVQIYTANPSGALDYADADATIQGPADGGYSYDFGSSLVAGDIDGDGFPDLLVGEWLGNAVSGGYSGMVLRYDGGGI